MLLLGLLCHKVQFPSGMAGRVRKRRFLGGPICLLCKSEIAHCRFQALKPVIQKQNSKINILPARQIGSSWGFEKLLASAKL